MIFGILSKRSSLWYNTRKIHLLKQNCCQACGTKRRLQVHHIEPVHINPYRELDPDNLITLCRTCHLVFGHLMDYSSWNKNVINDAAVYLSVVRARPYVVYQQKIKSLYFLLLDYYRKFYE